MNNIRTESPVMLIAAAAENELPSFSIRAYGGGRLNLGWGTDFVFDIQGMRHQGALPVLLNHDPNRVVGQADSVEISERAVKMSGRFTANNEAVRDIVEHASNGFKWAASCGWDPDTFEFVDAESSVKVNGLNHEGPLYVVRASRLVEVSIVPAGADESATTRIAASARVEGVLMTIEQYAEAKGFKLADMSPSQQSVLRAAYAAEFGAGRSDDRPHDNVADVGAQADLDCGVVREIRERATAESKRIAAVRAACDGKYAEIEARAIEDGWDADRTELEILRSSRAKVVASRTPDDSASISGAIQAAILRRAGARAETLKASFSERELDMATRSDYRGMSLGALCHMIASFAGRSLRPGRLTEDGIRETFAASAQLAASGFTTLSLPNLLSNAANKMALDAYTAFSSTWQEFCRIGDLNDLKTHTRMRLATGGVWQKVTPQGEIAHGAMDEDAYPITPDTFGQLFTISRTHLLNDDLSAFFDMARHLGRNAAHTIEYEVFKLLLSNPGNFFHADNKNYATGAGTALSINSLTTANQKFRDQVDKLGTPIVIQPAILLTGTALEILARQLFTDLNVAVTTTADTPRMMSNPFVGRFRPVASPFVNATGLAGATATKWYLFANPQDVPAMEVAFLNGQRMPTIEQGDVDYTSLGMWFRGYHDFGVAMMDHRAAVLMAGA